MRVQESLLKNHTTKFSPNPNFPVKAIDHVKLLENPSKNDAFNYKGLLCSIAAIFSVK